MPNENTSNYQRFFGIELEFNSGDDSCTTVWQKFQNNGFNQLVNRHGYGQSNGDNWEIKTDCTAGLELVSRKLKANSEGLEELYTWVKLADNLRDAYDWKVNKKCGFHVHLDISDLTRLQVRNLAKLFLDFEPVIHGLQPKSRNNNYYCCNIQNNPKWDSLAMLTPNNIDSKFRNVINSLSEVRYQGINWKHYFTRESVEVRYGGGTLNADNVQAWVMFLLALVEKAKQSEFCSPFMNREKSIKTLYSQAMKCFSNLRKSGVRQGISKAKKTLKNRFDRFERNQNRLVKYELTRSQ